MKMIWQRTQCKIGQIRLFATMPNPIQQDVRIAVSLLSAWSNPALLLELEAIILRAAEPPYNAQIPSES